jgi:hypothetical protein
MILAIAFEVKDIWSRRLKKSKIEEVKGWRSQRLKKSMIEEVKDWSLETQPESTTQVESRGLLAWACPSDAHGLVYRVRSLWKWTSTRTRHVDLESKKEGSNTYSTRTLVNPSLVVYIKPGRGAPERYLTDNRS